MAGGRTLHVKCTTWEQVEVFYTRKLRKGRLLSMKVPFQAEVGAPVTLGLELPNGTTVPIAGTTQKAAPIPDDTKTWIEIELAGFTDDVLARIKALAAGKPDPVGDLDRGSIGVPPPDSAPSARAYPRPLTPPPAEDLPSDERELFQHLTAELRRLRSLPVHEIFDVERDADATAVRRGWMRLVRRLHPDLVARHHAPAISHLAEEITILVNRAYDRIRAAMVSEGRATAIGSALQPPPGWLVGWEDISSDHGGIGKVARAARGDVAPVVENPAPLGNAVTQLATASGQGGEAFELRARAMLGDGDASNAQEVLAAALCVYPRSRPLRSLYYVASALAALDKGELMLATSQLETALAHHEQCTEAAQILEHLRRHGHGRAEDMRRLFR